VAPPPGEADRAGGSRPNVRRVAPGPLDPDLDPGRFAVHRWAGRGFDQAYVHEGRGGLPLLLVHGWPESKRIWWRVIEPLAAAGFEVVVPDLRGFGDSDVGPDGYHDVASHSRDLHALLTEGLGHERVVLCGGDLGGPVIQDLALRFPDLADRLCLFNSPLPYDREAMAGMATRPPREASDYFVRQGTDPDGLAADLATEAQRRRYVATFYTSRFWAHPGAFMGDAPAPAGPFGGTPQVDFHTEPFADAARLRASFGAYESTFDPAARSEPALLGRNPDVRALLLFGPSDHVIYPDFDRMAAVVFPDHLGPRRLDACGHFVPWEAPAALVDGLVELCADVL
jgi:pimeloyl-ACP methyl ester carboxylesterase